MLQGLDIGMNLNAPSWSISTEFAAYFLFPLLLAAAFARRRPVLVATLAVSIGSLVVIAAHHARLGLNTDTIQGGMIRCFAEFTIGLVTYRTICVPRIRILLASDKIAAASVCCSLLLLLSRFDLLTAFSVPVLVATLACNRGHIARLFSARVPYFLGVISFSIYLLHSPLRPILLELVRFVHPQPLAAPLAEVCALIGSILVLPVAWAGFVLVEKPGRDLIRGVVAYVHRRGPARTTPVPSRAA